MKTTKARMALLVLAGAIVLPISMAQLGTGNIDGTIYDSAGANIPGAAIKILSIETGLSYTTKSDSAGLFVSPPLLSGNYQVTAGAPGFKTTVANNVMVEVGTHAEVNLTLSVGVATNTITISAAPPDLNTSDASLGSVIGAKPVHNLPLNGRAAMALTALTPGVRNATGPDVEGLGDRGDLLSAISINGSPIGANANMIDGLNNYETQTGEAAINLTVDAVQEFRVESGTISALYGYTAGGVVNLVTRSGTDQFHGTAYEFFRNDALDASPYFTAVGGSKPEFRYNQYGAALGGPVARKRTFFFANYEQYNYLRGIPTYASVPTVQERGGNFSDLYGTNGTLIPIYDPATTQPNPAGPGYVRQRFSGNTIPTTRLDPAALSLQALITPAPNTVPTNALTHANNYVANVHTVDRMRQSLGRLDHRFAGSNTGFLRYIYYNYGTNNPDVLSSVAGARNDNILNQSAIAGYTQVFSPTLINDVRLGFTRNDFTFTPASYGQNWPQKLGLPSSVPSYTIPLVSNGLPSYGTQVEFGVRAYTNPELTDTVVKIVRSHTLTFGTDLRMNIGSENLNATASGSYTFAAGLSGNPQSQSGTGSTYATYLLGQVSAATATTLVGETDRATDITFFMQDDWKAAPRLTLNLGLRYDYQQQPYDQNNHYSNWNPNLKQPNGLAGAYQFAGVNGAGRNFTSENFTDFGPRIGFAWAFTRDSKSVLRAGYGIYYWTMFSQVYVGSEQGFSNSTSYAAANSNFAAFQFSSGLPSPPIPPLGSALGPSAFLGQTVTHQSAYAPTPMSQQWNISLQREFPWKLVGQVTYVGNHGTHFASDTYNSDTLNPQYLSLGLALQSQVPNPYDGIVPATTSLGGATISEQQALLPYPYYTGVTQWYPHDGSFIAHYLEIELNKQSTRNLSFMIGYTAGKLISTPLFTGESFVVSQPNSYQNVYDRAAERSLDPTDVSQRATVTALYDLPFGKGQRYSAAGSFLNAVIGGWQLDDITVLQTGFPLAITGANNFLATRPNFVPSVSATLGHPSKSEWFNTAAFQNPPNYTFGNVGRTLPNVRAPKTVDFDLGLHRTMQIQQHLALELRLEAFNVFNHPNLGIPNTAFSPGTNGLNASGSFGTITSTSTDNRDVQLAARLIF